MLNIGKIIGKFVKNSSQRELDKLNSIVQKINAFESEVKKVDGESFPAKTEGKPRFSIINFAHALILPWYSGVENIIPSACEQISLILSASLSFPSIPGHKRLSFDGSIRSKGTLLIFNSSIIGRSALDV